MVIENQEPGSEGAATNSDQKDANDVFQRKLNGLDKSFNERFKKLENLVTSLSAQLISNNAEQPVLDAGDVLPQQQIKRQNKSEMQEIRDKFIASENKRKRLELDKEVREALAENQITNTTKQEAAMALLIDRNKRIYHKEDPATHEDSLVMLDSDGTEVSVAEGIKSWVKTSSGQVLRDGAHLQGEGAKADLNKGKVGKSPSDPKMTQKQAHEAIGKLLVNKTFRK